MTSYRPRVEVPAGSRVGLRFGTDADHLVADFAQRALAGHSFDPVLVEAVRLRCASTHDCRACLSLRSTAVGEEPSGSPGRLDLRADLPERVRVALRLTDAMLATPVVVDAKLRADVRRHFSDEEVARLAFLVMKWAHQKVHVALRIEPPIRADALSEVTFTDDGRTVLGGALQG